VKDNICAELLNVAAVMKNKNNTAKQRVDVVFISMVFSYELDFHKAGSKEINVKQ